MKQKKLTIKQTLNQWMGCFLLVFVLIIVMQNSLEPKNDYCVKSKEWLAYWINLSQHNGCHYSINCTAIIEADREWVKQTCQ